MRGGLVGGDERGEWDEGDEEMKGRLAGWWVDGRAGGRAGGLGCRRAGDVKDCCVVLPDGGRCRSRGSEAR